MGISQVKIKPSLSRSALLLTVFADGCGDSFNSNPADGTTEPSCIGFAIRLLEDIYEFHLSHGIPAGFTVPQNAGKQYRKRILKARVLSRHWVVGQLGACRPVVHGSTLSCRVVGTSFFDPPALPKFCLGGWASVTRNRRPEIFSAPVRGLSGWWTRTFEELSLFDATFCPSIIARRSRTQLPRRSV